MTNPDIRTALWLSIEDYSGLWELVWALRANRPNDSDDALVQAARKAAIDLVHRKWIDLYRCEEPYGELFKLDPAQAIAILSTSSAWQEPAKGSISIRMGATPQGEEEYRSESP